MAKFESKHNIGECVKFRSCDGEISAGIVMRVVFREPYEEGDEYDEEIIPVYLCKVGVGGEANSVYVYDYENSNKGPGEAMYTIIEEGDYQYAYNIEIHYRDGKNDSTCTDDWDEIHKYMCDAIRNREDIISILLTKYGETIIDYNAAYDE